jgi:hypothetical protein
MGEDDRCTLLGRAASGPVHVSQTSSRRGRCWFCAARPSLTFVVGSHACPPVVLARMQPLGASDAYVEVFVQSNNRYLGATKEVGSNNPTWNKVRGVCVCVCVALGCWK